MGNMSSRYTPRLIPFQVQAKENTRENILFGHKVTTWIFSFQGFREGSTKLGGSNLAMVGVEFHGNMAVIGEKARNNNSIRLMKESLDFLFVASSSTMLCKLLLTVNRS